MCTIMHIDHAYMDTRTEVSNDLKALFRFSLHTATALGKLLNDLEEVETLMHTHIVYTRPTEALYRNGMFT